MSANFTHEIVQTPRLAMNVWTAGPTDGTPVLLIHGNLTTGGFWKYVAEQLPDDVRVIAPDMRGFGRTEPLPIDATRGLGDMVEDVRSLLETLGLADQGKVHAAGWSMGAGVIEQYLIEHPGDFASLTLIAPLSPYGFGGTTDTEGTLAFPDGAASGGGAANQEFVARLAAKDSSDANPQSSPRIIMRTFFGAGDNAADVDEDFLVDELLTTVVGADFYPGDSTPSANWPTLAPAPRGVLNTMAPTYYNSSAMVDVDPKPPIAWMRGTEDQVVSDRSMFDLATLGELGAIPGWPGADVLPPQPMDGQMRAVLATYAARGGATEEIVLDGVTHGIPLTVPGRVAETITAHFSK